MMAVGFGKAATEIMYHNCPEPPAVDDKEVTSLEKFVKKVMKMTIKRQEKSGRGNEERAIEITWTKKTLDDDDEEEETGSEVSLRKFSVEEMDQLSQHFHDISKDTNGVITQPQFLEAIEFVTHAGEHFGESLFKIFDESKDEQINFSEFKMAMHVLCRGSPEERLSYVFKAYDTNGDGHITHDELLLFLLMANKVAPKEARRDRE